jgi:hypothetical protein
VIAHVTLIMFTNLYESSLGTYHTSHKNIDCNMIVYIAFIFIKYGLPLKADNFLCDLQT